MSNTLPPKLFLGSSLFSRVLQGSKKWGYRLVRLKLQLSTSTESLRRIPNFMCCFKNLLTMNSTYLLSKPNTQNKLRTIKTENVKPLLFLLTSWNLLPNNNDYNHLTYFYTCDLNSHFSFIKDLDTKNMKFLLHFIYLTSLKFSPHSRVWNTGKNLLQNINFMISRRLQPCTVYLFVFFFFHCYQKSSCYPK